MGGSIERKEVRVAMESVSTLNVQMDELAFGIGKRLSELTGAEWGIVTAGCAAGMKMVTAACLTGGDPEKLLRIPDLTGFAKSEVIIPFSSRSVYDHAIRNAGVKVITVESLDELKKSINSRTAMIYMSPSDGEFSIPNVSKIARSSDVPLFVDAAAHILTIPDVHLAQGADVVGYSGGKGIKAPSCSGLMLGRKDLLMSAHQANSPHHGFGRDNKVGREEHIGMLAAVEAWVKLDHVKEMNTWVSWLETINKKVSAINGIKTSITRPDPELIHHVTPYLHIRWNPEQLHVTGEDIAEELGTIAPRIAVQVGKDEAGLTGITLVGYMMVEGNDVVAANRIHEVLSRKRQAKVIPPIEKSCDEYGWPLGDGG
jgi:D-glucosaminate-6-phosphate ammonia-lyase